MADTTDQLDVIELIKAELGNIESDSSGWDAPIVCRVEVDLPSWLSQLTGGEAWEVYAEDEEESCISFAMREVSAKTPKLAEVTLYHNGYAVVDVDGKELFDGSLTSGTSNCAHLTYYHADTGEKITLN